MFLDPGVEELRKKNNAINRIYRKKYCSFSALSIQRGQSKNNTSLYPGIIFLFLVHSGIKQELLTFSTQLIFKVMTETSQRSEKVSCSSYVVVCL